jgi:membrane-bound metal-dependent hydrolase YbcI (DUF457 family)
MTAYSKGGNMKASTHVGFAELLYLLLLTTAGIGVTPLNGLAVAAASVIPDIDTGASAVGRAIPPLTRFVERRFGHRTLTHSLPFTGLLLLLLLVPITAGSDACTCAMAGYLSHLLLDTCTPNGVRLFYPFSGVRCVFPFDGNSPHRFRVETGSKLDTALGVLFFAACVPALYIADQGYERFIRVTQHSIEPAVRDYEASARTSVVFAAMDAHDQLSGQPLKGRFQVLGALNPRSLVFQGADGRLHTVGREFESDFIADNIVCIRGGDARATVITVDMGGRFVGSLPVSDDTLVESLFFGEIVTSESPVIPGRLRSFSPVTGEGKRIRMNFARGSDLRELDLEGVLADRGTVIVKTVVREGAASPAAGISARVRGGIRMSYVVSTGEDVVFRKCRGDTIRAGEILAVRKIPGSLAERRALNEAERNIAATRGETSLIELDRALADAALAAESDSLGYAHASVMVARGYASPESLLREKLNCERSQRLRGKIIASRRLLAGKEAVDRARLTLADAELRAKEALRALRSEFRSTLDGILQDIRREPLNGRERIVFIVKRCPT